MTEQVLTSDDEMAVRELIEHRANALRQRSAAQTLSTQAPDYVQYPLSGVLQHAGQTAMTQADLEGVFAGFTGPIDYEMHDLQVTMGDPVAVSRSLSRISATLVSGGTVSMWFRKTLVFQKTDGRWLITLEHESVPMSVDGGAATTLEP